MAYTHAYRLSHQNDIRRPCCFEEGIPFSGRRLGKPQVTVGKEACLTRAAGWSRPYADAARKFHKAEAWPEALYGDICMLCAG